MEIDQNKPRLDQNASIKAINQAMMEEAQEQAQHNAEIDSNAKRVIESLKKGTIER